MDGRLELLYLSLKRTNKALGFQIVSSVYLKLQINSQEEVKI